MEMNLLYWIAIGTAVGLGLFNAYFQVKRWMSKGDNPHPCGLHGERLKGLETDVENIKKDIERIFTILNRRK